MRRSVLCLATGVVAALLSVAPAAADEGAPEATTRSDGSVTYTDPALTTESTTRVEGVLQKVVGDTATGSSESTVIVTDDNTVIPVDFDATIAATDVPVTAQLVDGSRLDAALEGNPTPPVEVASARVASATLAAAGIDHHAYVVRVTDSGPLDSVATIENRVDTGLSYWQSEGGVSLPTFTRAGTANLDSAYTGSARCGVSNPSALWSEAANKFPAGTFSNPGNHLIVVVSNECSGYGVGMGTLGSSINSGGRVVMTQDSKIFTTTVAHELGHNFGLRHANFCSPSCVSPVEYWNLFSTMGLAVSNSASFGPPALDSAYRDQLGITTAGETELVTVGESLTTNISPRGSASGLRGIEVRTGSTSYWVDYRDGSGRDSSTFYAAANGSVIGNRSFPDGVTVTRQLVDSLEPTALMARTSSIGSWSENKTFTAGNVVIAVTSLGSTANVSVAVLAPVPSSTPTLSSAPRVAKTVSAMTGGWESGATFAYQWRLNGTAISGANGPTYYVRSADYGKKLSVSVSGTKSGFFKTTRTSAQATIQKGLLIPKVPTISGTHKVGKTLRAVPGTWTYGPKLTYRWYANGSAISGATSSSYKVTSSKKGKYITVKVTASKTAFNSSSRTSLRTVKVS